MTILTPNGQFTMIKTYKSFAESSRVKALANKFTKQIINIGFESSKCRIHFSKTDHLRCKYTMYIHINRASRASLEIGLKSKKFKMCIFFRILIT